MSAPRREALGGWNQLVSLIGSINDHSLGSRPRPQPSRPVSSPPKPGGVGAVGSFNPLGALRPAKPARPRPVPGRPAGTSQYGTHVPAGTRPDGSGTRRPSSGGNRGSSGSNRVVVNRNGVVRGGSSTRAPQTYKGPNGEVRPYRGGGATRGAGGSSGATGSGKPAAAKDPLEELVDKIIGSRVAPIQDERRQIREQSAADVLQQQRLNEMYQQQLTGLRGDANLDLGAAINKAAELRGISADTIAANQEWLRSFIAPTNGGTGDAQVAESTGAVNAESASAFDSMGRELAARGESLNDWLAKQNAIGTTQTNELVNQERLRRAAAEREMAARISQEKGQRAEMLYQMQQAEREAALKEQAAAQAFGLDMAKFQSNQAYQQGQLALQAARLEQGAQGKPQTPESMQGRYPGIPKRYDPVISSTLTKVQKLQGDSKLPQPWRQSFEMLGAQGLSPAYAAMIASRWFPESITRSTPYGIRQMMASRGVPVGIIRNILNASFGPNAWTQSTVKPPRPGQLGNGFGSAIGQVVNVAGNMR